MIDHDQVIPMILKACPSFQEIWDTSDNQDLFYNVMWDLANHVFTLYQAGLTDEFGPLCEVIERFLVDGDTDVRILAIDFSRRCPKRLAQQQCRSRRVLRFPATEEQEIVDRTKRSVGRQNHNFGRREAGFYIPLHSNSIQKITHLQMLV